MSLEELTSKDRDLKVKKSGEILAFYIKSVDIGLTLWYTIIRTGKQVEIERR